MEISGAKKIKIELTVDQWQFIQLGLKDIADRINPEEDEEHPVDQEQLRVLIEDNLDLAAEIERQMLEGL